MIDKNEYATIRMSDKMHETDPYSNRESAIKWLRDRLVTVVDDSKEYNTMTLKFPRYTGVVLGKELEIVKQFGEIVSIDFNEFTIHIYTANGHVFMKNEDAIDKTIDLGVERMEKVCPMCEGKVCRFETQKQYECPECELIWHDDELTRVRKRG